MKMLFAERLLSTLLVIKVCQSVAIYQPSWMQRPFTPHESVNQSTHWQQPQSDNINIYPVQHQTISRWTATSPKINLKTNESPVQPRNSLKDRNKKDPLFINYHNEIVHLQLTKGASPLANNKHWENLRLNARKQRNLRQNHDNKLIEQNIEEMENANERTDQQSTTNEVSSKQPPTKSSRPTTQTSHEMRYSHDIFLNYPQSHHVNFGHIELSPALFERRFETQKAGNRYRGEIMWLDKTGSFAQHNWDLAQGRL